jgi:hypothetical protein
MTFTPDGSGAVTLVPRPALQRAINRHFERLEIEDRQRRMKVHRGVMTKDAAPTNNLGVEYRGNRSPSLAPGNDRRRPNRDQSSMVGTSQGSTGSPAGSRGLRQRPTTPTPASLRGGQFTTGSSDEEEIPSEFFPNGASSDQDPDANMGLGQTIAVLEDPGPGLTYRLESDENGDVAVDRLPQDQAVLAVLVRPFQRQLFAFAGSVTEKGADVVRRKGIAGSIPELAVDAIDPPHERTSAPDRCRIRQMPPDRSLSVPLANLRRRSPRGERSRPTTGGSS